MTKENRPAAQPRPGAMAGVGMGGFPLPRYDDDGGNATFAPSFNVDDDAVLLSNLLEQLTFKDVIFVGLTGLAASCALVGFFEVKRRTRSAHRMIFCPRLVWEAEVEAVSKRHGGDYAAQKRGSASEARLFDWVVATLFERTDADVLRHAGLEMYVFLRFVRLCLRICVFGSAVVAPTLASPRAARSRRATGRARSS